MIYLFESIDNYCSIVYDENTLTEQQKYKGISIETLPQKEEVSGKIAVLKCKKSTNEVWYEYIDVQKSQEQILQDRVTDLENILLQQQGVI